MFKIAFFMCLFPFTKGFFLSPHPSSTIFLNGYGRGIRMITKRHKRHYALTAFIIRSFP